MLPDDRRSRPERGGPTEATKLVTMKNDRGQLSLPVFTDQDLAQRYWNDSDDLPDKVTVGTFDTPEKLADLLDVAQADGIAYVVFDPKKSSGANPRAWPIAYAAERIRNRLDLQ